MRSTQEQPIRRLAWIGATILLLLAAFSCQLPSKAILQLTSASVWALFGDTYARFFDLAVGLPDASQMKRKTRGDGITDDSGTVESEERMAQERIERRGGLDDKYKRHEDSAPVDRDKERLSDDDFVRDAYQQFEKESGRDYDAVYERWKDDLSEEGPVLDEYFDDDEFAESEEYGDYDEWTDWEAFEEYHDYEDWEEDEYSGDALHDAEDDYRRAAEEFQLYAPEDRDKQRFFDPDGISVTEDYDTVGNGNYPGSEEYSESAYDEYDGNEDATFTSEGVNTRSQRRGSTVYQNVAREAYHPPFGHDVDDSAIRNWDSWYRAHERPVVYGLEKYQQVDDVYGLGDIQLSVGPFSNTVA